MSETLEFVYNGTKYSVRGARIAPTQYMLIMNDTFVTADLNALADGGFLVRFDGHT